MISLDCKDVLNPIVCKNGMPDICNSGDRVLCKKSCGLCQPGLYYIYTTDKSFSVSNERLLKCLLDHCILLRRSHL